MKYFLLGFLAAFILSVFDMTDAIPPVFIGLAIVYLYTCDDMVRHRKAKREYKKALKESR